MLVNLLRRNPSRQFHPRIPFSPRPFLARFRMASTFPDLPIFRAIASHDPHKTAIIHSKSNRRFTYGELLKDVEGAKVRLYHQLKAATSENEPIGGQRVAFLMENGYDYVVTLLSIFACDSIAIPLSSSFPASELRYIIDNSEAVTLLSTGMFQQQSQEVLKEGISRSPTLNVIDKTLSGSGHDEVQLVQLPTTKGGMMLYTSGTTSRPKGVVLNTSTLTAQCQSLLHAWNYLPKDHLLHTLPLHHIHGTVNALLAPLFSGSTIEFLFPFNADAVWSRLAAPFLEPSSSPSSPPQEPITYLTAVPTIYTRLLSSHPRLPPSIQSAARSAISPSNLRLNISGSAALPTPTKTAWSDLSSGNVLLERYGMTEVGMALSCGLAFTDRVDGSVGWPLPSVEVRLVDTETSSPIPLGDEIDPDGKEKEGEIQLRGPTIFSEYWRNESATSSEFALANPDDPNQGRWFKTGDVATRRSVPGTGETQKDWATGPCYFIKGRKSTDIIKTGGEKVSALEIERELLGLEQVAECAVVGIENEQWGQKVCAIVVLADGWVVGAGRRRSQEGKGERRADEEPAGKPWSIMDMRRALKDKLAAYKVPQEMKVVAQLQKNAMGKVNKKALAKDVFGS